MHEPGERPEREQQRGEQPVGLEPERGLGHQLRVGSSRKMSRLTPARLRPLLVKAGRHHLDRDIDRLREIFTDTYLHQPPQVETAMGIQLSALLRQFDTYLHRRRRARRGGDRARLLGTSVAGR